MAIAAIIVLMAQNVPVPIAGAAPEHPRLRTTMSRVSVEVRLAPTPAPAPRKAVRAAPAPSVAGTGACGGNLPSCSIMHCESKGSLTARNASGAAGKWQIMPGTWNGYGGYSSADQAPEDVQDAKARELWRGGAGAGHWRQCL